MATSLAPGVDARFAPERLQPAPTAPTAEVVRPEAAPRRYVRRRYHRGKAFPRGVRWFGFRSLWGHVRHFLASAVATEDVDSRDWMHPDKPHDLVERIARRLAEGSSAPKIHVSKGGTLCDTLGRDVWIDFVADTGDDFETSRAVANLVFAPYELPDPDNPGEHLTAPRGDILFFGGDTAYPVATVREIQDRVIVPYNQVLQRQADAKPRVLLGIPGNHDWYDGLDGFARLFRRKLTPEDDELEPTTTLSDDSPIEHYFDWAESFVFGGQVTKRKALVLDGYESVQRASYFVLPLTKNIQLFGVDRQLTHIDFRQRRYFTKWRERTDASSIIIMPDPVYHFGEPSPSGVGMRDSLALDLENEDHLIIAGDIHHYNRFRMGKSTHITSGGGGAFLHPAALNHEQKGRRVLGAPDSEWPDYQQCRKLLWKVPFHVAKGGAGFIPHIALLLLFTPALGIGWTYVDAEVGVHNASIFAGVTSAIAYALLGGITQGRPRRIGLLAAFFGAITGLAPALATLAVSALSKAFKLNLDPTVFALTGLVTAVAFGTFAFGAYLSALTRLGLEHMQAFTALGHQGFKEFLRLRVRADGSAVDVWAIGLEDPLAPAEKPVLVDSYTWTPTAQGS